LASDLSEGVGVLRWPAWQERANEFGELILVGHGKPERIAFGAEELSQIVRPQINEVENS
jgi:hypothetical protein